MNPIRLLRTQAGISQQALADLARTSQPTIALYESGAKSPTLTTLQRLASSLGLELAVTFTPLMTREDHRSLAYHHAVVKIIIKDPKPVIMRARKNLERLRRHHPGARELLDRWRLWLELPAADLVAKILDPGLMARDMRQVTPFAGLLKPRERVRILKKFQEEYGT